MNLTKRITDIILSSLLLILLSPLMCLVALIIKLDSRGPVFFRQRRAGKNGGLFNFYKFRSMYVGIDQKIHEKFVIQQIKKVKLAHKKTYKLTRDPRITGIGYWIRKTSIDELPQLFNVLIGDMSLVGPRPPIPYEIKHYTDYQKKRLSVVPGITGLWQVSGRSKLTYRDMIDLDIKYISKQSWINDMIILAKTIPAIFHIGKAG